MEIERLQQAMIENGYNQKELAEKIGVSPSTISHLITERRGPSSYILRELAIALHVSADWLLGLDKEVTVDHKETHKV